MEGYYVQKLSAQRLEQCYRIALPRVQRYFEKELQHVLDHIAPHHTVLDLGCGFGRTLPALAEKAAMVYGIDSSTASISLAQHRLNPMGEDGVPNCRLAVMNALRLAFAQNSFDIVCCIQNGISAFHVDKRNLLQEALRVTKPSGLVLFSGYSEKFWRHRLHWFKMQAEHGLLGELDMDQCKDGTIVCKDGFKACTVTADQFRTLSNGLNALVEIREVDESSLFCQLTPLKQH